MSFNLSVNAARQLDLSVTPSATQSILAVTYALCQYAAGPPATWTDVSVNGNPQSLTLTVPSGSASPTTAQVAQLIKNDTAAKFGTAVDTVLVAGTLY